MTTGMIFLVGFLGVLWIIKVYIEEKYVDANHEREVALALAQTTDVCTNNNALTTLISREMTMTNEQSTETPKRVRKPRTPKNKEEATK